MHVSFILNSKCTHSHNQEGNDSRCFQHTTRPTQLINCGSYCNSTQILIEKNKLIYAGMQVTMQISIDKCFMLVCR